MTESTHEPSTPDPAASETSGARRAPRAPRWLRVTAVAAAIGSVLALAGVAALVRGPLEHRVDPSSGSAGHHAGGPMVGAPDHVRSDGVRGRLAGRLDDRRSERRADAAAARHEALAATLGVEVADVEAALATGRAAGHEAALAAAAEALGVDVETLRSALAEVRPDRAEDGPSL